MSFTMQIYDFIFISQAIFRKNVKKTHYFSSIGFFLAFGFGNAGIVALMMDVR